MRVTLRDTSAALFPLQKKCVKRIPILTGTLFDSLGSSEVREFLSKSLPLLTWLGRSNPALTHHVDHTPPGTARSFSRQQDPTRFKGGPCWLVGAVSGTPIGI